MIIREQNQSQPIDINQLKLFIAIAICQYAWQMANPKILLDYIYGFSGAKI